MIITKLVLHNFGVYAGTNTFYFQGTKPVVLIGGMNGRGKTTFLEAVLLALYGQSSFAYTESSFTSYNQYLKSYVNKSDNTMLCSIDLEFKLEKSDNAQYLIHREWTGNTFRANEKVIAYKNGQENEFLSKNWAMFIENILPSGLSNFFFFDGEKIAELAVESTSAQIKESIKALLGITVIDQLQSDLNRIISKTKRDVPNGEEETQLEELRAAKEQAVELLAACDKEIQTFHEKMEHISLEIEQKKAEYATRGGEIVNQKNVLIQNRAALITQLETTNESLLSRAAGLSPLSLVQPLLWRVKTQSELEQRTQLQIQACDTVFSMFEDFSKQSPAQAQAAVPFLSYIRSQMPMKREQIYGLSDSAIYQIQELLRNKIDIEAELIRKEIAGKSSIQKKIDEIDHYLSVELDEKSLAGLFEKISSLERQIVELNVSLSSLKQQRIERNSAVLKTTAAYNKFVESYLNKLEVNDDGSRIIKYAYKSLRALDLYKVRIQERKIHILADTTTRCYKRLADKKTLIEKVAMDPNTLDLAYLNSNGDIVAASSLSAGEKQLMVVSLLWALGICSGKKLPVIIDTPLSRLDSNHRTSLINIYFPNASDQTIILSTDSEVDRHYYEMMKPNLSDEYTLVYDEKTKSSSIHKGYFTEALK